jgi:hypothetical protein
MGLLRRPTTSEIVEDGRFSRPYGPGAHSRASEITSLRLTRHSAFHAMESCHCRRTYGLVNSHVLASESWQADQRRQARPDSVRTAR